jgi:endonuclease G
LVDTYPDVWVWTGKLFLPQKADDGKYYIKYEVCVLIIDSEMLINMLINAGQWQVIGNPPNVAVPTHFYKVLLAKRNGTYSTASFVFPNRAIASNATLESFKVAQEAIERASGLTFLTNLQPSDLKDLCTEIKCAVKTQHS